MMKRMVGIGWAIGIMILLIGCAPVQEMIESDAAALMETAASDATLNVPREPDEHTVLDTAGAEPLAGSDVQASGPTEALRTAHRSVVPEVYAELTNPVSADADSLERGAAIYATSCALCHGNGGIGEGPAGSKLNPPASPVARSSQMMSDAYLYWRIAEGGQGDPLTSAMPAWKATLDEQTIWDVINYMRSLGAELEPHALASAQFDPAAAQANHDEMLATALERQLISAEDAAVFERVHDALDAQVGQGNGVGPANGMGNPNAPGRNGNGLGQGLGNGPGNGRGNGRGQGGPGQGQMRAQRMAGIGRLVADGVITQDEALAFEQIIATLQDAGLKE